jgi:hypothetical protein
MNLKDRTENVIGKAETLIAEKGVGSGYLTKAKKIQRNLNLGLIAVSAAAVTGVTLWILRGRR